MNKQDHNGVFFGSSRSRIVWDGEPGFDPHARCSPRVVAWDRYMQSGRMWWIVLWMPEDRTGSPPQVVHEFDQSTTDIAPHVAFCRGTMPDYAYADWLEEQGVPLPQVAFDLLRA